MAAAAHFRDFGQPLILSIPGLDGSGPVHWQTLWERQRGDMVRVEMGDWHRPHRNNWVTRIDHAVRSHSGPIILCAHSLGCLAVAWWAALSDAKAAAPVAGAFLVAPPDCDASEPEGRSVGFCPTPRRPLPFRSTLVASRDDRYASFDWSRGLAAAWGSEFVDMGEIGHINAQSDIGDWPDGKRVLRRMSEGGGTSAGEAGRDRRRAGMPSGRDGVSIAGKAGAGPALR